MSSRLMELMARASAFSVCILLLSVSAGAARQERSLADGADGVLTEILDDTITNNTVYQQVSITTGSMESQVPADSWLVVYFDASIELSTNASYSYNYLDANGTSRFNVTMQLTKAGGTTTGSTHPPAISATIHTVNCNSSDLATSVLGVGTQTLPELPIISADNSITQEQSGINITNGVMYDTLINYDNAKSVVLKGAGTQMACRNLQPPFPDFPNDWSAAIEMTDSVNGSTFVFMEYYSQAMNKIRMNVHSYGEERILIIDSASSSMNAISPSNGSCNMRYSARRTNWITGEDNVTLLSTADLLHFTKDEVYYVPGNVQVRGIECEQWKADVTMNFNDTEDGFAINTTFTATFYFPVNQWLVARESYHRMLKAILLNGTRNGEKMETWINYVNFRPFTPYNSLFDTCAISPYGENCNCTDSLRRAAFANISQVISDGGDIAVTSTGDGNSACKYNNPIPHGFVREQSGPYVGLTIIGMVGGGLITGLAMYLFYRKRVGVRITDNLGHTKFHDTPGM